MSGLSEDFRSRAATQAEASAALFNEPDFQTNAKKQALAIIGQVNSTIYGGLADMLDTLPKAMGSESMLARRLESLRRNDAIRKAAAKGEWSEFDKLVAGLDTSGESTDGSGQE